MIELTETALCLLLEVALRNPARSQEQQDALVDACKYLDNDLVNWSAWAQESWDLSICDDCDRLLPRGDVCPCHDESLFDAVEMA